MSDTSLSMLEQAQACHDDDPPRAADLLRRLDPSALPAERWPGLAFLLNHVLGEKIGAWDEAHALFGPLLRAAGEKPLPALWRQAATAAQLAGDQAAAARLSDALAAACGASAGQAREAVSITAAMYLAPSLPSADAAALVARAVHGLEAPSWEQASPLDAAIAACANNIASSLLQRPQAELRQEPLRATLAHAAQLELQVPALRADEVGAQIAREESTAARSVWPGWPETNTSSPSRTGSEPQARKCSTFAGLPSS